MSDPREADDDDYNSSSDEDYDPTKDTEANPQDEIDDNEEGEEELEEDVDKLKEESGAQKKSEASSSSSAGESKVDVDAIFAELTGLAPPTTSTTVPASTSTAEKVYPKTVTATPTEALKVYPRTPSEQASQGSNTTGKKRVGLLDAAKALSKRSKMSVLERSDQDWKAFTAQNNLKEDLESHNRGKGGYLNKMEFLDRADNRQFEKERAFRASARKDTNN